MKLANKMQVVAEDFFSSFRRHIHGDRLALDVASMRSLARSKSYRSLVVVPGDYDVAWRMMWSVRADSLQKVLGRRPEEHEDGVCVEHDPGHNAVASWTIDLTSLHRSNRRFLSQTEAELCPRPSDGYAVLLAAWTSMPSGPRRFWLNPDELYDAANADRDLSGEREVVSVGPVGKIGMSYARAAAGGSESWNDIMDWLFDLASREDPAILRACPRRARRTGRR